MKWQFGWMLVGAFVVSFGLGGAEGAEVVTLWPEGATPGAKGKTKKDIPTLHAYAVAKEKATGAAVLVCPGGGYGHLAVGHEGREVAAYYNKMGVSAFVLHYRHAPGYKHPVPLMDATRGMRWVRAHAAKYHVDPNRIGVMGFSAGGHLASTLGTHFDKGNVDSKDVVERVSSRPNFLVLGYPVISMGKHTHGGSKRNLIGKTPDAKLVEYLSNEKQVTKETPPTFIFHTTDDRVVKVENAILFYMACRKAGVPVELHVYRTGRHGVGLASRNELLKSWPGLLAGWMKGVGWMNAKKK